ncbi:PHP domain-containing protein [Xylanibacillus composti]|nr:PHP domain-containing protein [Xylanibacillus composti]MDT9724145.1 PHP domain-containing protein [Xylanibacillus composti]
MPSAFVDLHTHTTASDGTCTPGENVKLAAEAGLAALAITDHDTFGGLSEALKAGRQVGIEVVPGVEISTAWQGQDIHILGYFLEWEDAGVQSRLADLRDVRAKRNERLAERLRQLDMPVTLADVERLARANGATGSVGRPHFAEWLVQHGYCADIREAFDKYLGKDGAAYVQVDRISPFAAIDFIHESGGAAVIAHPGLYDADELVEQLTHHGADGIEAAHADHDDRQEQHYRDMAERSKVLVTAGSDFHGYRNGEVFHAPLGSRRISIEVVRELERVAIRYKGIRR